MKTEQVHKHSKFHIFTRRWSLSRDENKMRYNQIQKFRDSQKEELLSNHVLKQNEDLKTEKKVEKWIRIFFGVWEDDTVLYERDSIRYVRVKQANGKTIWKRMK